MNIRDYIEKKTEVERSILQFLDEENVDEANFAKFLYYYKDQEYEKYWYNFKEKLHLLLNIISNSKPSPSLYNKIEQLFVPIQDDIKKNLSNLEIFQFFESNKLIILYFFNNKIIILNSSIFDYIMRKKNKNGIHYILYFFPELKRFYQPKVYKKFKGIIYNDTKLKIEDPNDFEVFINKRKIGENPQYVCELIRKDLIDDFIVFVNQTNLNLSSKIKPSIFETNSFLLKNDNSTTLIEYSAFYGSIRIFKYLLIKNIKLTSSIWLYSIHSRNAEILQILEDNNVEFPQNFLKEVLKIHDIEITEYFIDNSIFNENKNKYLSKSIKYCNYSYYPTDLTDQSAFYYYNKCEYINFIKMLENDGQKFNINIYDKLKALKKVMIPSIITSIPSKSFNNSPNLTEIILPSSLQSIGPNAFQCCFSLTKIRIPSSIKVIENNCFYKCFSLKEVIFEKDSQITLIDKYAFCLCKSLEQITIPPLCKTIGMNAFSECYLLKLVNISKSVTVLDPLCFYKCYSLEKVSFEIPTSLSRIEERCFAYCKLKQMWIPYSITYIGSYAFANCSSCNICIPHSLKSFNDRAFYGCKSCNRY